MVGRIVIIFSVVGGLVCSSSLIRNVRFRVGFLRWM